MVVQLYSALANTTENMLPETFEREFYIPPKEVGLAYGLPVRSVFWTVNIPRTDRQSVF
jgi:hypothetical protein